MTISERGIAAIRAFESFRAKAYPDPKTGDTPWTVGYGSIRYEDGATVKKGDIITEARANYLLRLDVAHRCETIASLIKTELNQNQIDSIISLSYNIGVGAFSKSTLLKKVNKDPNDPTIADEFMRWINKGTPVEKGLTRRRKAEVALYYTPV